MMYTKYEPSSGSLGESVARTFSSGWSVVNKYLEYASRISLSLLDETRDQDYFKKIHGLIHLPSNILEYAVEIKCDKCGTA